MKKPILTLAALVCLTGPALANGYGFVGAVPNRIGARFFAPRYGVGYGGFATAAFAPGYGCYGCGGYAAAPVFAPSCCGAVAAPVVYQAPVYQAPPACAPVAAQLPAYAPACDSGVVAAPSYAPPVAAQLPAYAPSYGAAYGVGYSARVFAVRRHFAAGAVVVRAPVVRAHGAIVRAPVVRVGRAPVVVRAPGVRVRVR